MTSLYAMTCMFQGWGTCQVWQVHSSQRIRSYSIHNQWPHAGISCTSHLNVGVKAETPEIPRDCGRSQACPEEFRLRISNHNHHSSSSSSSSTWPESCMKHRNVLTFSTATDPTLAEDSGWQPIRCRWAEGWFETISCRIEPFHVEEIGSPPLLERRHLFSESFWRSF